MQKLGTDLEDVAAEALVLGICNFVRLVLIYDENIVVVHVVNLSADKKAFSSRYTEKDLTAIVDMYVRIRISLLRIIDSEACVFAGIGYCSRAAFKYVFHKNPSRFQNLKIEISSLNINMHLLYHTMVRIATF